MQIAWFSSDLQTHPYNVLPCTTVHVDVPTATISFIQAECHSDDLNYKIITCVGRIAKQYNCSIIDVFSPMHNTKNNT